MADESYVADTWLYSTLSGDAALAAAVTGFYSDVAPQEATFPYVIYSFQGGHDVGTVNATRIWSSLLYQVKVVSNASSFGAIAAIVRQIDSLLHRTSGTPSGGVVVSCDRQDPLRYVEFTAGKQYLHLGGLYRLQVQSTGSGLPDPEEE